VKKVPIHLQSAQNRLLIKNGTVINDDGSAQVDVYMEDNSIRMVGKHLIIPGGTRIIDATGKYLLPGGIDANVHLQVKMYFLNFVSLSMVLGFIVQL
jgi:dihydropyrimidinase